MTKKQQTVEERLRRLEEIVSKLESGDLDLEGSLASFEEGMRLAGKLAEELERSRERILRLERDLAGHRLDPFDDAAEPDDDE